MINNSDYGITFLKLICEKYDLYIHESAMEKYDNFINIAYKEQIDRIIPEIFEKIGYIPVKFLAYTKEIDDKGNLITLPDDFLLSNGKRLSIKTIENTCKVAPRVLGQAGYNVLNMYFEKIYGKKIENQNDIRKLFIDKIDEILPFFLEKTFISDLTLVIKRGNENDYYIISKEHISYPKFIKSDFEFTRNLDVWKESNTLKYKGVPVAEIQINRYSTFKFRFLVDNLLVFILKNN